jgi:hypothetical protein
MSFNCSLPTGTIGLGDIKSYVQSYSPNGTAPADFSASMSWLDENSKYDIKPTNTNPDFRAAACYCRYYNFSACACWTNQVSEPTIDMAAFRGKYYYKKSNSGNCNTNPVPTASTDSGNKQCTNCSNVAVDCANCDSKLWVQSQCNCACTYNCTQTADQTYNCDCNCNCACFWSDDQLKIKKTSIRGALGKVNDLNGFYYQGNATARKLGLQTEMDVGVSAQDVYKVLPEALGERMGQYQTVRYERLVPLLVEAIKELNDKVDSLNKQGLK